MTYEELKKVNSEIKTTDVKGKDYAEVNQRIKAFRKLYPNGCISTNIEKLENGVCVIKATVFDEKDFLLATGYAYEKEGSTFINKTSYIENCETSAVGRALGMLGIGIDVSVASYEEVANAVIQQEHDKAQEKVEKYKNNNPIDIKTERKIVSELQRTGQNEQSFLEHFKITKWGELDVMRAEKLLEQLEKKPDKVKS